MQTEESRRPPEARTGKKAGKGILLQCLQRERRPGIVFVLVFLISRAVLSNLQVTSDSLWLHGLQRTWLPRPPLSSKVCSNSWPLSWWCYLILCHSLLLLPSVFPCLRVFSNESALHIKWPKNWSFSFSISPSNKYSGLISFRIDWFDLLEV